MLFVGRASDMMNGVRDALSTDPTVTPLQRGRAKAPSNVLFENEGRQQTVETRTEHSDYTYGAAADQLKTILKKHTPKQTGPKFVQFGQNVRISFKSMSESVI